MSTVQQLSGQGQAINQLVPELRAHAIEPQLCTAAAAAYWHRREHARATAGVNIICMYS